MEKEDLIWIDVYADTTPYKQADNNLLSVLVSRETTKAYFDQYIGIGKQTNGNIEKDTYESVNDWLADYWCDDTDQFYEFAKKRNAIIATNYYDRMQQKMERQR